MSDMLGLGAVINDGISSTINKAGAEQVQGLTKVEKNVDSLTSEVISIRDTLTSGMKDLLDKLTMTNDTLKELFNSNGAANENDTSNEDDNKTGASTTATIDDLANLSNKYSLPSIVISNTLTSLLGENSLFLKEMATSNNYLKEIAKFASGVGSSSSAEKVKETSGKQEKAKENIPRSNLSIPKFLKDLVNFIPEFVKSILLLAVIPFQLIGSLVIGGLEKFSTGLADSLKGLYEISEKIDLETILEMTKGLVDIAWSVAKVGMILAISLPFLLVANLSIPLINIFVENVATLGKNIDTKEALEFTKTFKDISIQLSIALGIFTGTLVLMGFVASLITPPIFLGVVGMFALLGGIIYFSKTLAKAEDDVNILLRTTLKISIALLAFTGTLFIMGTVYSMLTDGSMGPNLDFGGFLVPQSILLIFGLLAVCMLLGVVARLVSPQIVQFMIASLVLAASLLVFSFALKEMVSVGEIIVDNWKPMLIALGVMVALFVGIGALGLLVPVLLPGLAAFAIGSILLAVGLIAFSKTIAPMTEVGALVQGNLTNILLALGMIPLVYLAMFLATPFILAGTFGAITLALSSKILKAGLEDTYEAMEIALEFTKIRWKDLGVMILDLGGFFGSFLVIGAAAWAAKGGIEELALVSGILLSAFDSLDSVNEKIGSVKSITGDQASSFGKSISSVLNIFKSIEKDVIKEAKSKAKDLKDVFPVLADITTTMSNLTLSSGGTFSSENFVQIVDVISELSTSLSGSLLDSIVNFSDKAIDPLGVVVDKFREMRDLTQEVIADLDTLSDKEQSLKVTDSSTRSLGISSRSQSRNSDVNTYPEGEDSILSAIATDVKIIAEYVKATSKASPMSLNATTGGN